MTEVAASTSRYDRSIVEGPLRPAVWKIAWPTMLTNAIGGLQGMVDHVLVGNLVGYKANAAIGVSWQIFLVVIVFISSLFTGMSVLVARFAGAGEPEKVDRVVYQAFLTAIGLALGILAPVGYLVTPWLLDLVNAAPAVKAEALPYLRIMFGFSSGMMIFFMLGGALRSAGDARTPMILGIVMTVVNLLLNIVLIRGLGPIPSFGTRGSAMGTCITAGLVAIYALWKLGTGLVDHPRAVPLWASDRDSGDRDEHRRRLDAVVHRIARAERRRAGRVRGLLHRAVFTDHVDIGGIDGFGGGRGGAKSWCGASGPRQRGRAHRCALRAVGRRMRRSLLPLFAAAATCGVWDA